MSKLIALIYADAHIPAEIYEEVRRLQNEGRLDVLDVLEVEIKDNGKLKYEQAMSRPLVGHAEGLFLPALVGLLFFNPQQAVNDNVQKTMADISLDKNFIQALTAGALPRNSVLFLYLQNDTNEQTLNRISQHGGQLLQMSLSGSQEEKLEKLFHGHHLGDSQVTLIHSP